MPIPYHHRQEGVDGAAHLVDAREAGGRRPRPRVRAGTAL